jgi:hypothetical protein
MDASVGRVIANGLMTVFVVCVLLAFGLGYGCSRGCDYVKAHYSVEVKSK